MTSRTLRFWVTLAFALWLVFFLVVTPLKAVNNCLGQFNFLIAVTNKQKTEEMWSREVLCAHNKVIVTTYKSCLQRAKKNSLTPPEIFFKIKGYQLTPEFAIAQHNQFCSDFPENTVE